MVWASVGSSNLTNRSFSWNYESNVHVFDAAFAAAAGVPLARDVEDFWRRYLFWYRWLPFLTSGAALW